MGRMGAEDPVGIAGRTLTQTSVVSSAYSSSLISSSSSLGSSIK